MNNVTRLSPLEEWQLQNPPDDSNHFVSDLQRASEILMRTSVVDIVDDIFYAIDKGYTTVVRRLLDDEPAAVNAQHVGKYPGWTPLMFAASRGQMACLNLLLDRGADLNRMAPMVGNALMVAITFNQLHCVEVLLGRGASPRVSNELGATPLHLAASRGDAWLLGQLIKYGADLDAQMGSGRTPLICATVSGFKECVKILLCAGANPLVIDRSGTTALQYAESLGHELCLECLKDAEAKFEKRANLAFFEAVKLKPINRGFGCNPSSVSALQ